MAHRVLHLPGSTCPTAVLAQSSQLGLPAWPVLEPWLWATFARASAWTLKGWPDMLRELEALVGDCRTLSSLPGGVIRAPGWKAPPLSPKPRKRKNEKDLSNG